MMNKTTGTQRKFFVRADASAKIGRGHLSRTIAAVQMLCRDFEVVYLISASCRAFCEPFLKGWYVHYIEEENEIKNWVSTNDFLLIDGYDFDDKWRLTFQPYVYKTIFISDFPSTIKGVDIILNYCPNIHEKDYGCSVNTKYMLGLSYTLLRPNFLEYARENKSVQLQGDGIFACFGGADPLNLGFSFVQNLLDADFRAPIYFVTSKTKAENTELQGDTSNVHLMYGLSEKQMIEHMLKAKLVVVSASVLSYEAIALRRPLYLYYYIDNQALIYKGLTTEGAALGGNRIFQGDELQPTIASVLDLYHNEELKHQLIQRQIELLDGHSDSRIVDYFQKL